MKIQKIAYKGMGVRHAAVTDIHSNGSQGFVRRSVHGSEDRVALDGGGGEGGGGGECVPGISRRQEREREKGGGKLGSTISRMRRSE